MQDTDTEKPTPLDLAAKAWGIEQTFYDIWGKPHKTTPEVDQAILTSLGVSDAASGLEARLWAEWSRPLPITLVLGPDGHIPLSLPEGQANSPAELSFEWEGLPPAARNYAL